MKRWRRRLIWAGVFAIVLLGGVAAWFYYAVVLHSDFALRRAEAFTFRRMTVTRLAEQSAYRFFYATNRTPVSESGPLRDRFGRERQDSLSFGRFDAEIEPTLGLGMLINPTEWFQNEEIRLVGNEALSEDAFVEELEKLVDSSPYESLLIVVHGFREAFPSALRKTVFLGHVADIDTPILVFDWPGNQGVSLAGYHRARRLAEASGADLARVIELVIRRIEPKRLWLIANSMGAQVVVDAFGHLHGVPDLADAATEIEDVVLTAPDIDADDFDERFSQEIADIAETLTVYVSSNDRALLVSRLVNRARRGGESTLSPDQLEEAVRVYDMVEPGSERVTLVDVTPVNRTRNFHNFSLETPEFFDDLFLRLTNEETPSSRLIYRVPTEDGRVYWVLTRGR
jgi:esterase/lipase superfamily enzyme